MLVLSRKNNEAVVVRRSEGFEHKIKITVVELSRESLRPRRMTI